MKGAQGGKPRNIAAILRGNSPGKAKGSLAREPVSPFPQGGLSGFPQGRSVGRLSLFNKETGGKTRGGKDATFGLLQSGFPQGGGIYN